MTRRFDPAASLARFTITARLGPDRKSTRLNSSHGYISYAVFCLKKKKAMETPSCAKLKDASARRNAVYLKCSCNDMNLPLQSDGRPKPALPALLRFVGRSDARRT